MAVAAVAAACPAIAQGQASGPDQVTAFVDVGVVPMDRERVLSHQTVVVRAGHIVALGPVRQVAVPSGAVQVDGRGRYLIPGLADMHVHLRYAEYDDTVDVRDLLFVLLANGITTVRDMHSGGPGSWTLDLRRRVAQGDLLGPRIYTAGDLGQNFGLDAPLTPEAVVKQIEALKAAGHDFVKHYEWPSPIYDSVVATAARVGLPVVGHVPHEVGVKRVLRDHWASIEHLTEYLEPLVDPTGRWSISQAGIVAVVDGDPTVFVDTAAWMQPGYRLDPIQVRTLARATRRAGVWNCPTLSMQAWVQENVIHFTRDTTGEFAAEMRARVRIQRRWMDLQLQLVRALEAAGAGLLVGSDFGAGQSIVPGFSIHQELAALTQPGGLTRYQALRAATREAAAFLGTLDSVGTVAVGKRADLVLVTGNPLADLRNVAGPAGVMLGGRWLSRRTIEARLDSFPLRIGPVAGVATAGAAPTQDSLPHANKFYAWVREGRLRYWQR